MVKKEKDHKKTKGWLRTAFISATFSLSAIGSCFAHDEPNHPSLSSDKFTSYMSDETREYLGPFITDNIAHWANANVIVISENDLTQSRYKSEKQEKIKEILKLANVEEKINNPSIYNDFVYVMYEKASNGNGASAFLLNQIDRNITDLCVIVAPTEELIDPINVFAALSGMYEENIENIPETPDIYKNFIMKHEAGHCHNDMKELLLPTVKESFETNSFIRTIYNKVINGFQETLAHALSTEEELYADQFSFNTHEGQANEVMNTIITARSISSLLYGTNDTHSIGGAIIEPHSTDRKPYNYIEISKALKNAREPIHEQIILNTPIQEHANVLKKALQRIRYYADDKNQIDRFIKRLNDSSRKKDLIRTAHIMQQALHDVPKLQSFFDEQIKEYVEELQQEYPNFLYDHAKTLLEKGEFDHDPLAKKYVERAVEGMEKYMPTAIGFTPKTSHTTKISGITTKQDF